MSEAKKRNTHLSEFKANVGGEAVRGVKTVDQITQEFGSYSVQVAQWKREIQVEGKTLFEGKRGPQTIEAHSAPDRL
jgi:transposase